MARRNRVTPSGEVIATPFRGTMMGNRGLLHDAGGSIQRTWRLKRWIVCVLDFNGRRRAVMAPGRYTELFFLDEATALAAGHRPCAECRRERYDAFREAWSAGNPTAAGKTPAAEVIDDQLHSERLTADGSKQSYVADLDDLPDGVFVCRENWGSNVYLIRGDFLLAWSPAGYGEQRARETGANVTVLTPRSTVAAIRSGYVAAVHASARPV